MSQFLYYIVIMIDIFKHYLRYFYWWRNLSLKVVFYDFMSAYLGDLECFYSCLISWFEGYLKELRNFDYMKVRMDAYESERCGVWSDLRLFAKTSLIISSYTKILRPNKTNFKTDFLSTSFFTLLCSMLYNEKCDINYFKLS